MEYFKCNQTHLSNLYSYRTQIERQLLSSLPVSLISSTNPAKVIRTAASILKLNLLECSLLVWLLKRSHYSLGDLSSSATQISVFQDDQNKSLLLLILLNAYHVKSFLNKITPPQIDAEFPKIYSRWRPDSLLKDASLEELNTTFSKWSLPAKRSKPDYNKLVAKILDLSKTYNVAGNEEQAPKKKRKLNEQEQPKQVELFKQQPQPDSNKNYMEKSNSMMLRSSRINRNNQNFGNIYNEDEDINYDDLLNDGGFNNSSIRRSTRLKNRYIFDLDNSLPAVDLPSQPLNNTIIRSNFRLEMSPKMSPKMAPRSLPLGSLKKTNSDEFIKE